MGAVELSGALADPEHVGRAVVPVAGERILPGERLFVVEKKCFVTGEEVNFVQCWNGAAVDAARIHEGEGAVDLVGHFLVALAGGGGGDELAIPGGDLAEVGVATSGEGPQQVQGRGGPMVGGEQSLGVGATFALGEANVVDDLAEERRQLDVALGLDGGGAGLGELTGDTADFHDRQTTRVREYDRHLKDHAELVAYRVGRTVKRFGAVTRLEQERFTSSDTGQLIGEVPSLAGEHEGRHLTEQFERLIELARIGPGRLVLDGQASPRAGCPGGSHSTSVVCREPGANSLFRGETAGAPAEAGAPVSDDVAKRCDQATPTVSAISAACSRTE